MRSWCRRSQRRAPPSSERNDEPPLRALGRSALAGLAEALEAGHIGAPITRTALAPHVPEQHLDAVADVVAEMEGDGMTPRHIARAVHLLVEERDAGQRMSDRVQLIEVVKCTNIYREKPSTITKKYTEHPVAIASRVLGAVGLIRSRGRLV